MRFAHHLVHFRGKFIGARQGAQALLLAMSFASPFGDVDKPGGVKFTSKEIPTSKWSCPNSAAIAWQFQFDLCR